MAEGGAITGQAAGPALRTEAFWAFSLAFYARAGVTQACLALQDSHGADVDVVLFALWCASRGHALDASVLASIDAAVAAWRSGVVQPIRAARRALKPAPAHPFDAAAASALRDALLAAELAAERQQQAAMQAIAPPPGTAPGAPAAAHNLACYADIAGIPPDAAAFATLLAAFT